MPEIANTWRTLGCGTDVTHEPPADLICWQTRIKAAVPLESQNVNSSKSSSTFCVLAGLSDWTHA